MWLSRLWRLTSLLLFVGLLDELSGVAFVSMPELMAVFGGDYAATAFYVFTLPQVVSSLVEPPLLLWAARRPHARRGFVVGGLLAMGLAYAAAGLVNHPLVFASVSAIAFIGSGVGVNLAQVTLVDAAPDRREALMARWTLLGTLGDLGTPLLLFALGLLACDYHQAFFLVGSFTLLHALILFGRRFPTVTSDPEADEEAEVSIGALRDRRTWLWLIVATLCSLLDEVFVALATLHLDARFHLSLGMRSLLLTACTAVEAAGLVMTELALARGADGRRLLRLAASLTLGALLTWIFADQVGLSAAALLVLGLTSAPLWPLAKAQAFATRPKQSAAIEAASSLLGWLELVFPLLLGWVADRTSLTTALLLLSLQPFTVFMATLSKSGGTQPPKTPQ